jgi:hypothetical protein
MICLPQSGLCQTRDWALKSADFATAQTPPDLEEHAALSAVQN